MSIHHNAQNLRVNGKIMNIIPAGGFPATSAVAMHPDGRMEIIDNYKEKIAQEAGWTSEPYKSVHPRSISLHSCADDDQAGRIAFYIRQVFPINFEKLTSSGHFSIDYWSAPLYHGHVLWSYSLMVDKHGDDSYSMALASNGSRAGREEKTGPSNSPPSLGQPPLIDLQMYIEHEDNKGADKFDLDAIDEDGHICFTNRFTVAKLREYAADGRLRMSMFFIVPRSYFALDKIIDLHAKPTVPEGAEDVVATILRGETPADADWTITGSHECDGCNGDHPVPVYAVHREKFASYEAKIKATPGDDDVGLLERLDDHALRLAIRIAYGLEAPLPGQGEYAKGAVEGLMELFGDHFTSVVVPQWERAICTQALALNKSDPSSMVDLLYLLNIIWESPYGLFPVAKRVAIGVMADMAHLNCSSSLHAWVQESVIPHIEASGIECPHVTSVLNSLYKTMQSIPHVEKMAMAQAGGFLDPAILRELEEMKMKD